MQLQNDKNICKNKKYWRWQSHGSQHKERYDTHTPEKIITYIIISILSKYYELTVEHLKIADKIYKSEKMKKHINVEQNGKIYLAAKFEIGKTAPPFHVNCRGTIEPKQENRCFQIGRWLNLIYKKRLKNI